MVRTARARADGRLIMTDLLEGIVNVIVIGDSIVIVIGDSIVIFIGDSIVTGTDNDDVYRHHNVHRPPPVADPPDPPYLLPHD
jgi:hypothetical protein